MGKWVKFKPATPLIGIEGDKPHITTDGYTVGIYQKKGIDAVTQTETPPAVFVVKPDGTDLQRFDRELGQLVRVSVPPDSVTLVRCTRADIPASRLVGMKDDWEPQGGVHD